MTTLKKIAFIALTAMTLIACGGDKTASPSSSNDAIKARQDLMQDWRGANDIMKGMMENPATFDPATFKEQANLISKSTDTMWSHFTDANAKGDSKEAVWTDAAGFAAKKDEFSVATINLASLAETAKTASDVEQAFGAMSESCGSCHKAYKK